VHLEVVEVQVLVLEEVVEDNQEQVDTAATYQDTVAVASTAAAAAVATIVAADAVATAEVVVVAAANYSLQESSLN